MRGNTSENRYGRLSRRAFYISAAAVSLLLTVLLCYVPHALDDLWFLDGIGGSAGWDRFTRACSLLLEDRIYTDTGRLGNLISPVFLALFPKIIYNILSGIIFFLLVCGTCRLTRVGPGSMWSFIILSFCTIGLPWYDYMLILTYGLNYLWSSAAAVWAAVCLLSVRRLPRRVFRCGIAVCFVAGWMHEGFGVPLSAAALAVCIAGGSLRRQRRILACATVAGTAMTALSPAIWLRLGAADNMAEHHYPPGEAFMHFGPLAAVVALFVAVIVWRLLRRDAATGKAAVIFHMVYVGVATALAVKFYCGPRTTTAPLLFAFAGAVTLAAPALRALPRCVTLAAGSLISAALCVHLSVAISVQRQLMDEFDSIREAYIASADGTLYADPIPAYADISLYKTTVRQFHEAVPRNMFSRYYGGSPQRKPLVILPSRLRGFEVAKARASSYIPGLFVYDGCLVARPGVIADGSTVEVADGTGRWHATRVRLQPFTDATDGGRYIFVMPHAVILDPSFRPADARFAR